MNKKFTKFLNQIAEDKNCGLIELLEEDGKLILDDSYERKFKGVMELHNCINNPFYFLDKCKIKKDDQLDDMDINISSFMTLKTLNPPNNRSASFNVIVDVPRGTDTEYLFLGYMLHKLLFTDGYCILNSDTYLGAESKLTLLYDMYNKLPNYLKVRPIEYIEQKVLIQRTNDQYEDLKEKNIKVSLIVYINNKSIHPNSFILDDSVQTIIFNDGGDSRSILYRIKSDLKNMKRHNFKIVKYSASDMGMDLEWFDEMYNKLNMNAKAIAQEIYMEYQDYTEDDIENLEE